MEHLDLAGRKRGSRKHKLYLWWAKYVQEMVTGKAHKNGMRHGIRWNKGSDILLVFVENRGIEPDGLAKEYSNRL